MSFVILPNDGQADDAHASADSGSSHRRVSRNDGCMIGSGTSVVANVLHIFDVCARFDGVDALIQQPLAGGAKSPDAASPRRHSYSNTAAERVLEKYFAFATVWGVGGMLGATGESELRVA